jgi:hypothetical protein
MRRSRRPFKPEAPHPKLTSDLGSAMRMALPDYEPNEGPTYGPGPLARGQDDARQSEVFSWLALVGARRPERRRARADRPVRFQAHSPSRFRSGRHLGRGGADCRRGSLRCPLRVGPMLQRDDHAVVPQVTARPRLCSSAAPGSNRNCSCSVEISRPRQGIVRRVRSASRRSMKRQPPSAGRPCARVGGPCPQGPPRRKRASGPSAGRPCWLAAGRLCRSAAGCACARAGSR